MREKDLTEKQLLDFNDVFSDVVNAVIYDGEEVIKPEDLLDAGTLSQFKADDGVLHEEERDILKHWSKNRVDIAVLGVENQTNYYKFMPLRMIGYEGASYRSQLLKEPVRPLPVVSLVLYFGKKHWKKNRSLKEFLTIPQGMEKYVNDYHINVIEVSWLSEDEIARFKSDFRIVADYFVNRRKSNNYIPDDTVIEHVDAVLKLLRVMTGDVRFEIVRKEGGVHTMCEVLDRVENRGIEKGKEEGIREGIKEGAQLQIINLVRWKLSSGMNNRAVARYLNQDYSLVEGIANALMKLKKDCSDEDVYNYLHPEKP